mmetsp:Transcript_12864/g.51340  ORF Transcript_12864/g.51340 Transcript_12864/m.51340 type:complete len:125 (+) Transcript_12864:64-438(+)
MLRFSRSFSCGARAAPAVARAWTAAAAARPLRLQQARPLLYLESRAGNKTISHEKGLYTPQPAIDLVHEIPPKPIQNDSVSCDGGGGALGHPLVYISLEHEGEVKSCDYCGLRFVRVPGGKAHH